MGVRHDFGIAVSSRVAPTKGWLLQWFTAKLVRLLRPFVFVRLVRLHSAFGYVVRATPYYLLQLTTESSTRKLRNFDIAFWAGPEPDAQLAEVWARQFRIVQSPYPKIISKALNVIAWYWERDVEMDSHVLDFSHPDTVHRSSSWLNRRPQSLCGLFTESEIREVWECLESMGVERAKPIALLHVRDSSHDLQTSESSAYDTDCVNADPKTFQPAVNLLKMQGYTVLTVGNHWSSQCELAGVVPYHQSRERNPFRDFAIGGVASLYIGTDSGVYSAFGAHFRFPSLLTNRLISRDNPEHYSFSGAVILLKNLVQNGQVLSHSTCYEINFPFSDQGIRDLGLELMDNTPDEICLALKDLLDLNSTHGHAEMVRLSEPQVRFWKVTDKFLRIPRACKDDGAIIAPSFLERNPHWLD